MSFKLIINNKCFVDRQFIISLAWTLLQILFNYDLISLHLIYPKHIYLLYNIKLIRNILFFSNYSNIPKFEHILSYGFWIFRNPGFFTRPYFMLKMNACELLKCKTLSWVLIAVVFFFYEHKGIFTHHRRKTTSGTLKKKIPRGFCIRGRRAARRFIHGSVSIRRATGAWNVSTPPVVTAVYPPLKSKRAYVSDNNNTDT